eukprot:EG_transcript_37223
MPLANLPSSSPRPAAVQFGHRLVLYAEDLEGALALSPAFDHVEVCSTEAGIRFERLVFALEPGCSPNARHARRSSSVVSYGQRVQLRHVASLCLVAVDPPSTAPGKYFQVLPTTMASPSQHTTFILAPAYHQRRDGDPVRYGDQLT